MGVHYHPAADVTPEILAAQPLRIELHGRRYIRKSRSWRVFVDEAQTHDSRPVSAGDAAYLEQRFPLPRLVGVDRPVDQDIIEQLVDQDIEDELEDEQGSAA